MGHHKFNQFSAHESPKFTEWIRRYIGIERYERIEKKAYTIKKWTDEEKEVLKEELKEYTKKIIIEGR